MEKYYSSKSTHNIHFDNEIWNGACYGMTINDIKRIFPTGVTPQKIDTYDDGARVLFELEEFELVNNIFVVSFVFRSEILVRVQLNLKTRNNKVQSEKVFYSLRQVLTTKYKEEINFNNNDMGEDFIHRQIEWKSPNGINISLLLVVTGTYLVGHTAGVHLTYSIKKLSDELNIKKELNKL